MPDGLSAEARRRRARLWRGPDRWLHLPGLGPPKVDIVAPDGSYWQVAVWWAERDGRAIPAGIDVRSFSLFGDEVWPVLPSLTIAPVTAALIRGLRVGEILEATRQQAAFAGRVTQGVVRGMRDVGADDAARVEAGRSADVLSRQQRKGRPPDAGRGDEFIRRVADLYLQAKALGGEPARKPWAHVKAALAEDGLRHVTDGQIRNWYRRAVRLGYIEPHGSASTAPS